LAWSLDDPHVVDISSRTLSRPAFICPTNIGVDPSPGRCFTNFLPRLRIDSSPLEQDLSGECDKNSFPVRGNQELIIVGTSGELIRLINYVDDIATTLRRISASIPLMEVDERKRLADRMRETSTNLNNVIGQLDKGGQS
jgi:hypothetical protein